MSNCRACSDLRENAPEFVVNGVTSNVCTSLKNNTGLNPGNSNDDCEDTKDAIDCLVTNMADEVEAYDVCDWKDFMKKFIPNLSNVLHVIRCTVCGVWAKIKALEDKVTALITRVDKQDCEINYLFEGDEFEVGEGTDKTKSYIVAGQGVSFLIRSGGDIHTSDVNLTYVGGALIRGAGGLRFYTEAFEEPNQTKCYNFDYNTGAPDYEPRHSYNRRANPVWETHGETVRGNELIYEIRINKAQYPQVKRLYGMFGQESGTGGVQIMVHRFGPGKWAYGQHGSCNEGDGSPVETGHDHGHKVPDGWEYIQVRASYIFDIVPDSPKYKNLTPIYFCGIRFNKDSVKC